MVFYLKYRPQKIDELDNPSVRDTLKAVLSSANTKKGLSFHAFLFTGPKGLGKTSAARLLAKFLNCEKRKAGDSEPCNRCYQCTSITNGNNLDLVEIDAASNRGIDEIRELKERINLATVGAKYKVYIIDEVHMMTTEAFNALLKTLEEPPAHAVFVLCTTDLQKVPATIVSRCLQVNFTKATKEELVRSLKRIVKGEELKVEDEALEAVASLSDGSFRDGAKILQELSAKAGNRKITKEFVEENFKTSAISSNVSKMIDVLEERDTKKALDLVGKMTEEGINMKYFIESLTSDLHVLLLEKVEEDSQPEADPPLAEKFSLEEIKKLLELLMEASSQMKYAVLPQLPVELAIVEFCSESALRAQDEVRGPVASFPPASARSATASSNSLRAVGSPSSRTTPHSEFMSELILKVDSQNKMVAGVLRGVILKEMDGKKILLETRSEFHKNKLKENKNLELIENIAFEILGKKIRVEVI